MSNTKKIKPGVNQDEERYNRQFTTTEASKRAKQESALNRRVEPSQFLSKYVADRIDPYPDLTAAPEQRDMEYDYEQEQAADATAAAPMNTAEYTAEEEARASRMTSTLGKEVESGEVLEDEQLARYMCEVSQPRVLTTRKPLNRQGIVFSGQELPPNEEINVDDIHSPLLVSLFNNINSLKKFVANEIIPFELVRGINRLLNPPLPAVSKSSDHPLLDQIALSAQEDIRHKKIINFSKVIDNYYTSLEAPGRLQTGTQLDRCSINTCSSSQGDDAQSELLHGKRQANKRDSDFQMSAVNLCRREKVYQEIVEMAGLADKILQLYGVEPKFAVWSPYGPGPSGLKRLFLIFDEVVEPTGMVARIASEDGARIQAEIVTAFNIISGEKPITADAAADARIISTPPEAEVIHMGDRPAAATDASFVVSRREEATVERRGPNILNIPIREAYAVWYATRWIDSFHKYEKEQDPKISQKYWCEVELEIGYIIGKRFRRIPTIYEFRIERPLKVMIDMCSKGASWFCNSIGVDSAAQEGIRIEKKSAVAAASQRFPLSEWRQPAEASARFGPIAMDLANQVQLVGGGVRNRNLTINCLDSSVDSSVTISVFPVVQIDEIRAGGGGGGEIIVPQQITTVDNAAFMSSILQPSQPGAAAEIISSILQPDVVMPGGGIKSKNKRIIKIRRTRKIKKIRRKTRRTRQCKGKRCKGTKKRKH